jgi:DNA-binding NarL/FixJ family response regulator
LTLGSVCDCGDSMATDGHQTSMSHPRVLIAGADPATLNGIRIALQDAAIDVCGVVHSAREAVDETLRQKPEVCLIDIDVAGGGLIAAAEIRALGCRSDVVMLADSMNDDDFLTAMRAGAVGYVLKNISRRRLPAVIRAVLDGQPAIPRALVAVLMSHFRNGDSRRHVIVPSGRGVDLTSREWEVLDLLREGLSTREIADRLVISDITVRRHIGSVLKKLRVRSRVEALNLLQSA